MLDDIELLQKNIGLILKNKDKIMNDELLSNIKVRGTGVYFKKKHIYIPFTIGQLLKLWTAMPSCWWYRGYLTYRLDLLGYGWADAYSISNTGRGWKQELYDSDIVAPMIEDMVSTGKVLLKPKRLNYVIKRLKKDSNEV